MKARWKKLAAIAVTAVMASTVAIGATGCGQKLVVNIDPVDYADYTFNSYLSVSPSNWNELSYQDNNDTAILDLIRSPFFEYDYLFDEDKGGKFNDDGTINADAIVEGKYTVKYSAATKLEDVTATVAAKWGYSAEQKEKGGYAWKITLRDDLKWDDGTPITADDFVFTMKEQLNPDYMHYRAMEFYSANITIINAENYVKQGGYGYSNMISVNYGDEEYVSLEDMTETAAGTLQYNGSDIVFNIYDGGNWGDDGLFAYYDAYGEEVFGNAFESIVEKADEDGYVNLTKDDVAILCDMIAVLHDFANAEEYAGAVEDYAYLEWEEFCFYGKDYAEMDFNDVGIYAEGNAIVLCLARPLSEILNADGSLAYGAAYYLGSLPLVKKDLYDECRVSPVAGASVWTSKYNSSLATTASWGPYKLTKFRTDVEFELLKNDNWYGYKLEDNAGQYQTDRIYYRILSQWNTAWQYFLKGGLDAIGISVTIADDYRNAERAYFTPSDFTRLWNFQSSEQALSKAKGNVLLKYTDFRKALTLGVDRAEYASAVETSSQGAFGLFNSMYYYDVANGGVYRDTQVAKEAILRTYGYTQGEDGKWTSATLTNPMDLETAYGTVTGYNLAEARALLQKVYDEAVAAGDYVDGDAITLVMGFTDDNAEWRRYYDYLNKAWTELLKETPFEGKLNLKFDGSYGDTWATAFLEDGKYDICCIGGWSGGDWDMVYMLSAYLGAGRYAAGWNPAGSDTAFEFQAACMGAPETHTAAEWYKLLSENPGFVAMTMEEKLPLIAKLEEVVLQTYYSCPAISARSAALRGYKCEVISEDYNTFMAYGGIRYRTFNYTDKEWKEFVYSQKNHTLNYK